MTTSHFSEQRLPLPGGGTLLAWGRGDSRKPPLLLLHGAWQSSALFSSHLESLTQLCYVITFDMRGHGKTDKPLTEDAYHLDAFVDDLHLVVSSFHIDKADWTVVGVGTFALWILQQYAHRYPASVPVEAWLLHPTLRPSLDILERLSTSSDPLTKQAYQMACMLAYQFAAHMYDGPAISSLSAFNLLAQVQLVPLACSRMLASLLQKRLPGEEPTKDTLELEGLLVRELIALSDLHFLTNYLSYGL